MSFFAFYAQGGTFMHLITLFAIAVFAGELRRIGRVRRRLTDASEAAMRGLEASETPFLLGAMMTLGLLGTSMGLIEVHAAAQTVQAHQVLQAISRGTQIALAPFTWACSTVLPLLLLHVARRYVSRRLEHLVTRGA